MYGDVRKEVSEWSLFSFRNTQSLSSLPSSKSGGANYAYGNYGYGNFDRSTPTAFTSRKSSNMSNASNTSNGSTPGDLSIQIEPSSPVDEHDFIYGDINSKGSLNGLNAYQGIPRSPRSPAHSGTLSPAAPRSPRRGPSPVPFGAILKEVKLLNGELKAALLSHEKAQDVLTILSEYTEGLTKETSITKIYSELFKESGTCELLVETQRTHSHVSRVQVIAGRAIGSLAGVHSNIGHEIGAAGGIQLLVDSLRNHSDDSLYGIEGIEYALRALAKLMATEKNRDIVADCNGMEVIISIMGRYSDIPIIQSTGAEIIALGVVGCTRNVDSIITGFGLDVLITSMRGLPKEWKVQKWACTALYNISAVSDSKGEMANSESIGRKGGVNAMIEALAIHHNNLGVVCTASKALHSLVSKVDTNLERMSNSSEWTHVLISILGKYENESKIQVWLLSILGNAVQMNNAAHLKEGTDNENMRDMKKGSGGNGNGNKRKYHNMTRELIAHGAIQVAINGMRRNGGDAAVLAAGARTARALLNSNIHNNKSENGNGGNNGISAGIMEHAIKQVGGIAVLVDLLIQAANNNTLQTTTSSVTTERNNNNSNSNSAHFF